MSARVPLDLEPPGAGELCGLSCAQLVNQLALQPHPEGGWYREVHRSGVQVRRADGAVRCALTQILYLLPAGGISRPSVRWLEPGELCREPGLRVRGFRAAGLQARRRSAYRGAT